MNMFVYHQKKSFWQFKSLIKLSELIVLNEEGEQSLFEIKRSSGSVVDSDHVIFFPLLNHVLFLVLNPKFLSVSEV